MVGEKTYKDNQEIDKNDLIKNGLFMSPQAKAGGTVIQSDDVYSLGIIIYSLLA